jgi:putative transposase
LFTEVEWLRHIERSLGTGKADEFRRLFEVYRGNGCEAVIAEVMASYEKRMFSVSCFMQNVKQAFSAWYNKRNGRQGTLWEEAFRSVLVEGAGPSLATMAAYIDLNPVRARMVQDPADYLWSGYGEAMAAGAADGAKARAGLAIVGRILGVEADQSKGLEASAFWEVVAARYRLWLFGEVQEIHGSEVSPARAGFSLEEVVKVHAAGGKLSRGQMLRLKVNYFTRGGIFGSAGFINTVFESVRERFGKNRKTGARKMKGVEAGELRVLRDLHKGVG